MKVLISGAGIAGPALAWWLDRAGIESVLVERAPALRTGGYVIDFWGLGYDVAERMGILPELLRRGYRVREVRMVDASGRRVGGFPAEVFGRLTRDRFLSLPRGDLAAVLFGRVKDRVETVFGDEVAAIEELGGRVRVSFARGAPREFDLVVGADGLHSRVRRLAFGGPDRFEAYLGYQVAAFEVAGYRPRDEDVYVMFTEVGRQVARFSMRGDRTLFLFIWASPEGALPEGPEEQKRAVRERFGDAGWECGRILEAMESVPELYFDRVSQVRMDRWTRGRIGLLGDAAWCASLLAGQGSALALAGAFVLAGELHRSGDDPGTAFSRYEALLRPFLELKQKAARRFARSFVPGSRAGLWFRNWGTRFLGIPWVADLAFGRDLRDSLELPDYGIGAGRPDPA